MSLWLTSARSQLRAPVLVDQTMFTFQTHAQLNAAHLPLLNLLKDKPVLFDEDARLIIAKLQGAVVCAYILGACMHGHFLSECTCAYCKHLQQEVCWVWTSSAEQSIAWTGAARCCKAAAAAGRSAADGGALPDEDAPPDEGAAPDEGLPQLVAPQNDGNANAGNPRPCTSQCCSAFVVAPPRHQ